MSNLEHFKEKFIEEAIELMEDLEGKVLILEQEPTSGKDHVDAIFRTMHSIKGASGMYGFEHIGVITHRMESVYDLIRIGKMTVSETILNLTLEAIDLLKKLLSDIECSNKENRSAKDQLLATIDELLDAPLPDENELLAEAALFADVTSGTETTYYIRFEPEADITNRGVNLNGIFDEVKDLGNLQLIERPTDAHKQEGPKAKFYIQWELFLSTTASNDDIESVFLFVEDEVFVRKIADSDLLTNIQFIALLEQYSANYDEKHAKALFDYVGISDINSTAPEPDVAVELIAPKESPILFGDSPEKENTQSAKQEAIISSSIRVNSDKLDELMNLVSELVTTKAELVTLSEKYGIQQFIDISERVEKLSRQFRDNALNIRLVPIESTMLKFKRMVRSLSKDLNKKISFETDGTDTELDKTIIDSLVSPLMHIIRNSIDHGIETESERLSKGKSPSGLVKFIAFHSGANVFIQIQDDGKGIDPIHVKAKAVEKGLVRPEIELTERQIYDLLFLPGFTTTDKVTDVSGRGVGMDVVKKKITDLRGDVTIDSEVNLGTSVTIKLPLTLSIIDTLHVLVGRSRYLLPLSSVEGCEEIELHELEAKKQTKRLELGGELVPFINLRSLFGIAGNVPTQQRVVLTKERERLIAIVVDEVVGEHQAVLKPLGYIFRKQEYLAGASILGDGTVALILDTHKLINYVANQQKGSTI